MKRLAAWSGLAILVLAMTSCATKQASYLKEAANRETQRTVAQRLGPPQHAWELTTGETLWMYRYGSRAGGGMVGLSVAGPGWTIGRGSQCLEYILLFDREQVLRGWKEQPC